jgi:hypothetical protein
MELETREMTAQNRLVIKTKEYRNEIDLKQILNY